VVLKKFVAAFSAAEVNILSPYRQRYRLFFGTVNPADRIFDQLVGDRLGVAWRVLSGLVCGVMSWLAE